MASEEWINSAAYEQKPGVGGSEYKHVLYMARADEQREADERARARRIVERTAGGDAAEILAMLGITETP